MKLTIVFYQIVLEMPQTYNLMMPPAYVSIMRNAFAWIDLDWTQIFVPGQCLVGGFAGRLWLRGLVPLGVILLLPVFSLLGDIADHLVNAKPGYPEVHRSVLRAFNPALFASFCLCPGVSASIFSVWSCNTYIEERSEPPRYRSFLHDDPTIECSASDGRYGHIQSLGYLCVFLWPVFWPTCYVALLVWCRSSLRQQRRTPVVRATAILHQDYRSRCYFWEAVLLLQRLAVTGFVRLLDVNDTIRLCVRLLVVFGYLILLLIIRPYKRRVVGHLAALAQVVLVLLFTAALLVSTFDGIRLRESSSLAMAVLGFVSTDQIATVMLLLNFSVVVIYGIATLAQAHAHAHDIPPNIRLAGSRRLPELSLHEDQVFHLFLSHIWSSGQDQVAVIKRQLQLLLPGIKVFLDVDDLDRIDKLEEYIQTSQCTLLFLSKGYFLSTNCQREIRAALDAQKPLVLVHEENRRRGAPLEELKQECMDPLRSAIFKPEAEVIAWQRVTAFQMVSLRMICSAVLGASPGYASNPRLEIPGELGNKALHFRRPVTIYASDFNPGAWAAAEEIKRRHDDPNLSITRAAPPLLTETSESRLARLAPGGHGTVTFLVYCNEQTFVGGTGAQFADEVRLAREKGMSYVLVHECDLQREGVADFGKIINATPEDLVNDQLYGTLAVPLCSGHHREVSLVLIGKAFGGAPVASRV